MTFDFDEEIDRRAVPALKWHPMVLGEEGAGFFPAGVADMDFCAAPCISKFPLNPIASPEGARRNFELVSGA